MAFVEPGNYSKTELKRIGQRIREGNFQSDDLHILDNWRASHLYIINTFQSTLRRRRSAEGPNCGITVAQRLKRRPTIVDKLSRQPEMSLDRMHDIAGCRLIFPDNESLAKFRGGVLSSRAAHELIGGKERYDYIENPKSSGYRGIHDIYKYNVRSGQGVKWNGLRIEVQYRTVYQHSWATAVEISDIINKSRLKFSQANKDISRIFVLCSELLARCAEDKLGPCPELSNKELFQEYQSLENELHVIQRLRDLSSYQFQKFARSSKLFILINYTSGRKVGCFEAEGFKKVFDAVERYAILEEELQNQADVVLVGAGQQDAIKLAYTNYFSDASDFILYLDAALDEILYI